MKKIFFLTTLTVVFIFIPISASADVIINEIAWMGTENSSNDEWIELYNNGNENVDLTGWTLETTDGTPSINLLGNIQANGYFLLERTDDTSVPNITADQIYTGALSNSGEYLKLKDSSNAIIDEINATDGWPEGNNAAKQTMERLATGWQTSLNPEGTPKAQNSTGAQPEEPEQEPTEKPEAPSVPIGNQLPVADAGNDIIGFIGQEIEFDGSNSSDPDEDELAYSWNMGNGGSVFGEKTFTYKYLYPGTYLVTLMVYDARNYAWDTITVKIQSQQITINEFIPNPEGKDEENEWIEIYNDSDSIVDISDWQLDDVDGGSKPFTFPENTLIAPKNYLVFPRTITKIALNNTSDSVRLLLPEEIVFQEISYEDCKQGQSSARTDEGFVWSVPSPGLANITGLPTNIGLGKEKEVVYQGEIKTETTQEPSQDYSWYYQPPEQEIEAGYVENQLAMIPSIVQQGEVKGSQKGISSKGNFWTQNNINLILMIIGVILAGSIIGLVLTKFLKKPT